MNLFQKRWTILIMVITLLMFSATACFAGSVNQQGSIGFIQPNPDGDWLVKLNGQTAVECQNAVSPPPVGTAGWWAVAPLNHDESPRANFDNMVELLTEQGGNKSKIWKFTSEENPVCTPQGAIFADFLNMINQ